MIHTDQRYFQEIFHHLLSHVLKRADKGCIEFGYKLLENGLKAVNTVRACNVGEEYARCIQAGCDAFIRKPLNTTLLMDTMKKPFQQYNKDNQSGDNYFFNSK